MAKAGKDGKIMVEPFAVDIEQQTWEDLEKIDWKIFDAIESGQIKKEVSKTEGAGVEGKEPSETKESVQNDAYPSFFSQNKVALGIGGIILILLVGYFMKKKKV